MNPEIITNLQNDLSSLSSSVENIQKVLNGLKLNEQRYLSKNKQIPPGIACKVAYDANGLILQGVKLEASDIPVLQIDAINGLRLILEDKLDQSHLKEIEKKINNIILKKGNPVNVGIKINYDENGLIVSSSDLGLEDIPLLPLSKIDGLCEKLELIESHIDSSNKSNNVNSIKINPGTYPRITFDENGRVIGGSNLTLDDIPNELIIRINEIDSKIINLASQSSVDALNKNMLNKVDANDPIHPGEYTKVLVDSKGLITRGSKLSKSDLPDDVIQELLDINLKIKGKVDKSLFIDISNKVNTVMTVIDKFGDILDLSSKIEMKADDKDVKKLTSELESIKELFDVLNTKIPSELITEQLDSIQRELSTLSGRISVIEEKINISNR